MTASSEYKRQQLLRQADASEAQAKAYDRLASLIASDPELAPLRCFEQERQAASAREFAADAKWCRAQAAEMAQEAAR